MTSSHRFAAFFIVAACGCSGSMGDGLSGEDPAGGTPAGGAAAGSSVDAAAAPGDPGPGLPQTSGDMDGGIPVASEDAGSSKDSAAPPPPPPPPSVFDDAGAFVSVVAGSTHNAGQNCMNGCHNHGFTFAGTLTDGAGNAVAGAQVRLVDANGTGITVSTGANGNFHSSTAFTGPAHVGARTATKTVDMSSTITNGGCNGCHTTGGTTTPIHVP